MNKRIVKIATVILIITIILAIAYYLKKYTEKNEYKKLSEYMNSTQTNETEVNNEGNDNGKVEKLNKLAEENSDIVAWLEIPDTNISYPVLQSTDNSYYLDKNYKKEYSAAGSIFLDKDVDMNIPSSNFLIYGHRNKNGEMFEELINYQKQEFYEQHKQINLTTLKEEQSYEILAVFYSRVYYKDEEDVFRYYYFINAKNEEEYNEYVENAKKASIYETGVNANYGEQLLTLSTCEYSQENGRFVIVAKKN